LGWQGILALASVASVVVAIGAVIVALRSVRDQLWLHTFSEYTGRYASIVRELPSEARRPGSDYAFEKLNDHEQGELLNTSRAYLNLCSEEYYLHERGLIDPETWKIWCDAMVDVLRAPWIQTTWNELKPEYKFWAFCDFLDGKIQEAKNTGR
jgi:hypothetical protein